MHRCLELGSEPPRRCSTGAADAPLLGGARLRAAETLQHRRGPRRQIIVIRLHSALAGLADQLFRRLKACMRQ